MRHKLSVNALRQRQFILHKQVYQVRQNKVAPWSFSLFSQQPFGILISIFTHLFPQMFYI